MGAASLARRLRGGLEPPRFDDPVATRQAAVLHAVVVFVLGTLLVLVAVTPFQDTSTAASVSTVYGPFALIHVGTLVLLHRGRVQAASMLYVGTLFVVVTGVIWLFGGMTAQNAGGYVVLTVIAALVLGGSAGLSVAVLAMVAAGAIVWAETAGRLPPPMIRLGPLDAWIGLTANLVMAAFLVQLALQRFHEATARAERGERALRASVDALRATQRAHEAHARQGHALARLAQEVLQLPDPDVACRRAATLLAETLDAGHVAVLERDLAGALAPRCQRDGGHPWPAPVPAEQAAPLDEVRTGARGATRHGPDDAHPPLAPGGRPLGPAVASGIPGRERLHGVLVVAELAGGHPTEEDVTFVETVAGILGAVIEHGQAEDRLRHAQKMEVVGQLAGGVAHDFNNLLTSILSSAALAARSLPPGRPEHALLDEVRSAGELAALLTRQLLAFSRRQVLQNERLRLDEVVERMEALLRRLIGDVLEIRADLGAGDAAVECDRGNLEQVVLNLALNARDAVDGAGTLHIETRTEHLDAVPSDLLLAPGRYAVLRVRDDGCGMSEEVRRHLFEPFFSTKESTQGTGLGLFTVHGIVVAARGDLRVRSAPGQGACFEVFLPLAAAAAAEPEPPPAVRPVAPIDGELLLVEDDGRVRRTARRILEGAGFRVAEAVDGEAALARFDVAAAPELVITDLVMPRLGGTELAAALAERGYAGPILFMSGYAPDPVELARAPGGPVALLHKPFTPSGLLDQVHALLGADARPTPERARRRTSGAA
ncbi:MAG: ATP-binding protein [Myxococcota bacterium]|nr:ATP-binding protein [Myxococcota bacterium]